MPISPPLTSSCRQAQTFPPACAPPPLEPVRNDPLSRKTIFPPTFSLSCTARGCLGLATDPNKSASADLPRSNFKVSLPAHMALKLILTACYTWSPPPPAPPIFSNLICLSLQAARPSLCTSSSAMMELHSTEMFRSTIVHSAPLFLPFPSILPLRQSSSQPIPGAFFSCHFSRLANTRFSPSIIS